MAYTPTTWANGDTITAAKLNKLEQGVANSGSCLMVELTIQTGTADHTFAEIFEALRAGIPVYLHYPPAGGADWQQEYVDYTGVMPVIRAFKYDDTYRVFALHSSANDGGDGTHSIGFPSIYTMEAASPSSYPTFLRNAYPSLSSCVVTINFQ